MFRPIYSLAYINCMDVLKLHECVLAECVGITGYT